VCGTSGAHTLQQTIRVGREAIQKEQPIEIPTRFGSDFDDFSREMKKVMGIDDGN
jgi:hypothetical protein